MGSSTKIDTFSIDNWMKLQNGEPTVDFPGQLVWFKSYRKVERGYPLTVKRKTHSLKQNVTKQIRSLCTEQTVVKTINLFTISTTHAQILKIWRQTITLPHLQHMPKNWFYVKKIFKSSLFRSNRRIQRALNCGLVSCTAYALSFSSKKLS